MVQMCVKVSINAAGKYADAITDELCGEELLHKASAERQAECVKSGDNPEEKLLKYGQKHIKYDPFTKLQIKV